MTQITENATIKNCPAGKISHRGRVAQLAEQLTLNSRVNTRRFSY